MRGLFCFLHYMVWGSEPLKLKLQTNFLGKIQYRIIEIDHQIRCLVETIIDEEKQG